MQNRCTGSQSDVTLANQRPYESHTLRMPEGCHPGHRVGTRRETDHTCSPTLSTAWASAESHGLAGPDTWGRGKRGTSENRKHEHRWKKADNILFKTKAIQNFEKELMMLKNNHLAKCHFYKALLNWKLELCALCLAFPALNSITTYAITNKRQQLSNIQPFVCLKQKHPSPPRLATTPDQGGGRPPYLQSPIAQPGGGQYARGGGT